MAYEKAFTYSGYYGRESIKMTDELSFQRLLSMYYKTTSHVNEILDRAEPALEAISPFAEQHISDLFTIDLSISEILYLFVMLERSLKKDMLSFTISNHTDIPPEVGGKILLTNKLYEKLALKIEEVVLKLEKEHE